MKNLSRGFAGIAAALVLSSGILSLAPRADAQTDQGYFVGAINKNAVAALGNAIPETVVAASGAAQTLAFGTYGSSAYDITLTANCTLTINAPTPAPDAPAGNVRQTIYVLFRQTGAFSITLPANTVWANGATPTLSTTSGARIGVKFVTTDGGATYTAFVE